MKLSEAVYRIRLALNATQAALSQALGVRRNTISQYENGQIVPSFGIVVRLHALAPDGPEKEFLHDYLVRAFKKRMPEHAGLAEGFLESLTSREELLARITPAKGRPDPRLQHFAELCARLLYPESYIDDSVNEILEMWLQLGGPTDPDPQGIMLFRDAAAYLRVQLERLADYGGILPDAKRSRMLRDLGVTPPPKTRKRIKE